MSKLTDRPDWNDWMKADTAEKRVRFVHSLWQFSIWQEQDIEQLEEEKEEIIKAWESLPTGMHTPVIIGKWLLNEMTPVMDKLRSND